MELWTNTDFRSAIPRDLRILRSKKKKNKKKNIQKFAAPFLAVFVFLCRLTRNPLALGTVDAMPAFSNLFPDGPRLSQRRRFSGNTLCPSARPTSLPASHVFRFLSHEMDFFFLWPRVSVLREGSRQKERKRQSTKKGEGDPCFSGLEKFVMLPPILTSFPRP